MLEGVRPARRHAFGLDHLYEAALRQEGASVAAIAGWTNCYVRKDRSAVENTKSKRREFIFFEIRTAVNNMRLGSPDVKQNSDTAIVYDFISDFVNVVALLFGASLVILVLVTIALAVFEAAYSIREDRNVILWAFRICIFAGLGLLFYQALPMAPSAYRYLYNNITFDHIIRSPLFNSILCLILGLLAYSLRCRARGAYGVWEIIIGIIVSYQGSYFRSTSLITFIGGLYIIVRGMDNVYKSISDDAEIKQAWKDVFGEDT